MAGITTVDTIVDRVVALLRAYLNDEVDLLDTRNNAIGDNTDNSFATPTLASADIVPFVDTVHGKPIRVVVRDAGSVRYRDMQMTGGGLATGTAPHASIPRLDRGIRFAVDVVSAATGNTGGHYGAVRACHRVADAVSVILARFPDLSIPSTSKASLVSDCDLIDDSKAQEIEGDEWQRWVRTLVFEARTIESRA